MDERATEALHSIEPEYVAISTWRTIPLEELPKHLYRWFIEEKRSLETMSTALGSTTERTEALLSTSGIPPHGIPPEGAPTPRPSRLETYLEKAKLTAKRSTCIYVKASAVLINKRRRDVLYSYNGPPAGDVHCTDIGVCKKDIYGHKPGQGCEVCVAVHAEQNLICGAAAAGISTEGAVALITRKPCPVCERLLRAASFYMMIYPDPETEELIGFEFGVQKAHLGIEAIEELL